MEQRLARRSSGMAARDHHLPGGASGTAEEILYLLGVFLLSP
jgi:hypothetical protein